MRDYQGRHYRGSGHGARYLLTHCEPIDYAIVGEPSGLYVVNGQAGYLFVKIVIWGKFAYLTTRGHRGSGIAHHLIAGAVEFARARGAPAIEGYPVDNDGRKVDLTMAYVGTRKLFEQAGFTKAADTDSVLDGFPRVLMRLDLS